MAAKLGAGEVLPSLTLNLVGGGTRTLPEQLETPYGVLLLYRGFW